MNNNNGNNSSNEGGELALSEVLSSILKDEDLCDISFQGTDGIRVQGNRTILAARSKVFRQMLLGEFKEATSPVIKLGYEGQILQAVVEYIHTDSAQILNSKKRKHEESSGTFLDHFPALISLASAAVYFNLPGLSKKVLRTMTQDLNKDPSISFSVLETCRRQGPTIPEEIGNLALSVVRRSGGNHLSSSSVGGLNAFLVEDILKDDKMEMTELTAFKILQVWAEADLSERKSAAQFFLEKYIKLEKIDPLELSTTVSSSGLATSSQIAEAYKYQALKAREKQKGDFGQMRFAPRCVHMKCLWKKSNSACPRVPTTMTYEIDFFDCQPIISGIHQWKIKLQDMGRCILHFGLVAAGVPEDQLGNSFWRRRTGWAVDRYGDFYHNHGNEAAGRSGDTLEEGQTATLTLNLVGGEEGNGTLTWRVEDGEETVAFSNLLDQLGNHPDGFLPAVASSWSSKMRLLSFEQLHC